MIQRQPFYKARSIKHCVSMAAGRTMSLERKYDGEYCQVHVDMSKDLEHCIQIFSKSGRDSANDRLALQEAIRNGLAIGMPSCKIKQHAILKGELVAYSQTSQSALPFYHVRKHVLHGGRRIWCNKDPRSSMANTCWSYSLTFCWSMTGLWYMSHIPSEKQCWKLLWRKLQGDLRLSKGNKLTSALAKQPHNCAPSLLKLSIIAGKDWYWKVLTIHTYFSRMLSEASSSRKVI